MKLKTLKDVAYWVSCSSAPGDTDGASRMEEDMQDAAKEWIEYLDNDKVTRLGDYVLDPSENIEFYIKLAFKHFFNLEEE